MKPTLDELKLMAAKKLPNIISPYRNQSTGITTIFWYHIDPRFVETIKKTEWLHICHLLEEKMKGQEIVDYTQSLLKETACSGFMSYRSDIEGNKRAWNEISGAACWFFLHATYQQRIQSMFDCKFLTP